ncbi:hypothetical protein H5T87_00820 [bacterium]|nr:hypothetical protein [bacterium]
MNLKRKRFLSKDDIVWLMAVYLVFSFTFSLPYIVGALLTPPGEKYLGLIRISDDLLIYLSWIQQIRDGNIFFVNLYNSEPQRYPFFSFFPLILGWLARMLHISSLKALFLSRYLFSFVFILLMYSFLSFIFNDKKVVKTGLLIVLFSSGIGWLTGGYSPMRGIENSVDLWQPEATVFFTSYVNPLHLFSLIFIVGFFYSLLRLKGIKGGIIAGLCLSVLANAHSYDLIILASIWGIYIFILWVWKESFPLNEVRNALIALLVASPAMIYQLLILFKDPIFSQRAKAPLPSPSFYWYLTGMGFLIPLAVWGIIKKVKEKRADEILVFLATWAIAGFFLPYLPFPFQYKLFMGTQIPLAILSTMAITSLKVKGDVLPFLLPILFLSNLVIIGNRIYTIALNGPGNLSYEELESFRWLKENTPRSSTILAFPDFAIYIPAFTGRRVFAGHYIETVDFRRKAMEVIRFYLQDENEKNKDFLKNNNIEYVYYGRYERFLFPQFLKHNHSFLEIVFHQGNVRIFKVKK